MTIRERAAALALAIVLFAPLAHAASPEMLRLFEQGRTLVKEGRYEDAIPRFLEAIAIEPSVGALLNLGDCYEKTGKPAAARRRFLEAATLAGDADSVQSTEARNRAQRLEPAVASLVLVRHYEPELGEPRITIDGEPVAQRAERVEIDPGRHEIVVTFPELAPHAETITARAAETSRITIAPLLAKKADPSRQKETPPPPPPPPGGEAEGLGTMRWAAIGVGAAGVVGVAVGGVMGVVAVGKRSDLDSACPGYPHCADSQRADVQKKYDDAKSAATISTIGFVAGGALLAGAVVLWLVAPSKASATSALLAPRASGVAVRW